MSSSSGALAAVERVLAEGGDADDVLRGVVAALHDSGFAWAGISFVEAGELVLGPHSGEPAADAAARVRIPVRWQGERVAELAVDGATADDGAMLDRVAELVSGHCLVGWDTGGEPWT